MISVEEARAGILDALAPLSAEQVPLAAALGRVLAEDVASRVTQPPAAVSAMDGYAVRAADVARVPAVLRQVGISAAGRAFAGAIGPGECARIFTGAPLPDGADAIVIQENATAEGTRIAVREGAATGRFVRPEGLDFRVGDVLLKAGRRLSARDVGLAAAMNAPWLRVRRRPRVAILATGDELAMPGEPMAAGQIPSSNSVAVAGYVAAFGGVAVDLGVARDDASDLAAKIAAAKGCDFLVTIGGASVGDYDLVRGALEAAGGRLAFYKVAMRPGKPMLFGHVGDLPVLGLPGNPVSAGVTSLVFLRPALARLQGLEAGDDTGHARLGADLGPNDERQDYLRADLARGPDGEPVATPFARQDSSMLATFARAGCLVIRPPHAPPAKAGERVAILALGEGPLAP